MTHTHEAPTKQAQSALPPPRYLQALAPLSPDEIKAVVETIKADPDLGPGRCSAISICASRRLRRGATT